MPLGKLLGLLDEATAFRIRPQTIEELSNVEGGAEAIARLRNDYELHTLKSGELFARPKNLEPEIEALKTKIGTLAEQETSLNEYAYKYVQGEVPGGESPIAHALNSAGTISGVTIPTNMLRQWQKLHDTAGIINTRLMPKEFNLLPSTKSWDGLKIKNSLWHMVSNPKHAFKELSEDLVIKPTELKYTADKFGKHSRKVYKMLTKGLSEKEMDDLSRILEEGNTAEETFKVHRRGLTNKAGDMFEVSPKVQEAYYGMRMLLDQLYWLNNNAAVRQARANGFKQLGTGAAARSVRAVKGRNGENLLTLSKTTDNTDTLKWSKAHGDAGYQVIELTDDAGAVKRVALTADEAASMLHELPDAHPMIPYRDGYVPVIYKDQWAVNKLVRMKNGEFVASRVATAPTRVKANKAVANLEKSVSLGDDEAEAVFIASRKNDVTVDTAYGEHLHGILDRLSAGEVESLKKALMSMGMDAEIANSLEKSGKFFTHKRNSFMMRRGPRLKNWKGVDDADILPADEAIQKYLQSTSGYAANAEYMAKLEQKYLEEFGDLLTDPNDFLSPFKRRASAIAANGRSLTEARLVRGQLERLMGLNSDMDQAIETFIVTTLDKFAETRLGGHIDRVLDSLSEVWGIGRFIGTPSLHSATAKVKGFTAAVKLGMWNMSQAVVQGTAALNVIGKNPILAAKATKDVMQAIAPEIVRIGRTAKGRALYEAIDRSGFIAGFDYVELQRVAAKGTDKLIGSRALRRLADTHLLPYQLGEGGVRALAWFTERRWLISQIEKGLSKFSKADIDNPLFLSEVNRAASVTALNMSRVNQPLISRGIIGIPLQFKQFLVQQAEFLFNAKNFRTRGEMLSTWGAWVGAFGIQGMPWMFDLGIAAEAVFAYGAQALEAIGIDTTSPQYVGKVRRTAQENVDRISRVLAKSKAGQFVTDPLVGKNFDDARAFWNRWAQSGLISAMSDGEFNLASRASLARVFTEYYGTQSWDDVLFGPGYQTAVMLIDNNVESVSDAINIWRNGDQFTPDWLMSASVRGTRGVPGIQHPIQAAEMFLTGEVRDVERRLISTDPSLQEILLIGTGFAPDKRGERFERIEFTQRQKDAWKKWIRGRQQRIARLSSEGHTQYATALLDDTLSQIQTVNPMLAKEFYMSYSQEMLRRNLTESQREFMYRQQDAEFLDSSYDKFFFGRDTYLGWGDEDE